MKKHNKLLQKPEKGQWRIVHISLRVQSGRFCTFTICISHGISVWKYHTYMVLCPVRIGVYCAMHNCNIRVHVEVILERSKCRDGRKKRNKNWPISCT